MKRDEQCKGCQCCDCTYDYGYAVGSVFGSCLCNTCYGDGMICRDCNDHDKFVNKGNADCPEYQGRRTKMKYLYESHLGGLYTSDKPLGSDSLYCATCGDSDWLIGTFETIKDFWKLIKDDCDIDGSGGWSLQYIYTMMIEIFDLPDDAEYENDYDRDSGFCCNSGAEILARIEELIKETNNDIS